MRRKIIFSNYDDLKNPFYAGGGAAAIHEIARRLAARHDVTVLTGKYPGCRDETVDNVSYERIGSAAGGPRLGQIFFHFALPAQAARRDFAVWFESLTPPFSTACLQFFTRQPVIIVTQNLPGKAMAKKYKLPFQVLERVGLKTYRYAVALSEPIRAELLRANARMRVEVIPNGVDQALINQPVEKSEESILFLGRLDVEQKGLDMLVDAYRQVAAELAPPLVIAGSGIARDEDLLQRRIQEWGLAARVLLVGRVQDRQKAETFRRAMFLVMPSRFEGFPLTLLEAACYGVPIVLFSIPELAWLPASCCVKVPPFDVSAFGQAMLELARDPARRAALGRAAKSWVRAFSWDSLAERYEKFFAGVLTSP